SGNRTNLGTGTTIDPNNQLSTDGTWTYHYDEEGNEDYKTITSTGEKWSYFYDWDNRLTKVEHKPSTSGEVDLRDEFGYDVNGNRIWKSYDQDGDGTTYSPVVTKFAYDGNGNAWLDFTGTHTSYSVQARHIFGLGTDDIR